MSHDGGNDFDSLKTTLATYDIRELLSSLGALQLVPANLGRTLTLEFIAGLGAARRDIGNGRRSIRAKDLRRILSHRGATAISHLEDPPENLIAESFVFTGGPYILLPGIAEWPAFVLRELCRGLFLRTGGGSLPTFAREASQLVRGVMAISTEIANRARLEPGIPPRLADELVIPDKTRFDGLRRAVSYSTDEFATLLNERRVPQDVIEHLMASADELSAVSDHRFNPLFARPFVTYEDTVLAPAPGSLVSAAIHRLRCMAVNSGEADALAERYHDAVLHALSESLDRLKWRSIQPWTRSDLALTLSHSAYQFDDEKLAVVIVLSDDLSDHDADNVFGSWNSSALHPGIDQLVHSLETGVLSAPPVNDALVLLAPAGMGRESFIGLGDPEWAQFVSGGAPQLEMLSYLEAGDPQALFKFARADERLRRTTRVLSFSLLDEWNLYRQHNHGFYLSDEAPPTFLNVSPGGGGDIIAEVHRILGLRGIPSWTEGNIVEVRRLYESTTAPVWAPVARETDQVRVAVAIEGCAPVWILSPQFEDEPDEADLALLYVRFADLIAYWLWQLEDAWVRPLAGGDEHHIEIRMRLTPRDQWFRRGLDALEHDTLAVVADAVRATQLSGTTGVAVDFDFEVAGALMSPDNVGEREVMRVILRELNNLANDSRLDDSAISQVLDQHAPIGQRKKLMIVSSAAAPLLDRGSLRDFRGVQDADIESVLDRVGEHLGASLLIGRRVAKSDQNAVVQEAVTWLYAELQRTIATQSSDRLLETLLSAHESLIYEQAFRRLTVPAEIACFPDQPSFQQGLQDELRSHAAFGIASRFLIEYVAARPPAGFRPKSQTVVDYCIALSSQIAQLGFVSDAIEFDLADMEIAVLESGRLGMNHEMTKLLFSSYAPIFTGQAVRQSTADFSEHWETAVAGAPDFGPIDEATRAEWGVPFQDLARLMIEAFVISGDRDPVVMPEAELLDALGEGLGWRPERVERTLAFLTLSPREDFLKPSSPFKTNDVYPWRFGRPLSFVRRPFVRRDREEREILWGRRHLYEAGRHLAAIVTDGRIPQPKSEEMRRYIGSVVEANGEAFNDRVADALSDEPKLEVKRRVKKVPSADGPLKPPGDIDVLVARRDRREIWLLECKSLALSRTPAELHNELTRLLVGSERHPSQLARHLRRVDWARDHIQAIVMWMAPDASSPKKWKIKHAIVAEPIPVSSVVVQSGEPIQTITEVREHLTR